MAISALRVSATSQTKPSLTVAPSGMNSTQSSRKGSDGAHPEQVFHAAFAVHAPAEHGGKRKQHQAERHDPIAEPGQAASEGGGRQGRPGQRLLDLLIPEGADPSVTCPP